MKKDTDKRSINISKQADKEGYALKKAGIASHHYIKVSSFKNRVKPLPSIVLEPEYIYAYVMVIKISDK